MLQTEYKFGEVKELSRQIESSSEKVQFKNIFSNDNGGVVMLAFKSGQILDTHTAPAEVMVCVVEGEIEFTMIDNPHTIKAGEFLLMGQGVPHSVKATLDSKVMIVKLKA